MLDLEERHKRIVLELLDRYVPGLEVRAFGSRVTGKAEKHSDLDIVVMSDRPVPWLDMARLRDELRESMLPFRVDVLDWSRIPDHFKETIEEKYVVLRPAQASTGQ